MFINENDSIPKIKLNNPQNQVIKQAKEETEITINQVIDRTKEILTLLDVPPIEWVNLNDIDELYYLIYTQEVKLESIGFNRQLIKDIKKINNLKDKYLILNKIKEQYTMTNSFIESVKHERETQLL